MTSPVHNLSLDEIEQRAAYEIACGDVGSIPQYPVTAYQVLEALQVGIISCVLLLTHYSLYIHCITFTLSLHCI